MVIGNKHTFMKYKFGEAKFQQYVKHPCRPPTVMPLLWRPNQRVMLSIFRCHIQSTWLSSQVGHPHHTLQQDLFETLYRGTKAVRGLDFFWSALTASVMAPKAEEKSKPWPLRRSPQLRQKSMSMHLRQCFDKEFGVFFEWITDFPSRVENKFGTSWQVVFHPLQRVSLVWKVWFYTPFSSPSIKCPQLAQRQERVWRPCDFASPASSSLESPAAAVAAPRVRDTSKRLENRKNSRNGIKIHIDVDV